MGEDDPFFRGPVDNSPLKGPLLSLLQCRTFDRVVALVPSGLDHEAAVFCDAVAGVPVVLRTLPTAVVSATALSQALATAEADGDVPRDSLLHLAAGEADASAALLALGASRQWDFTLLRVRVPAYATDQDAAIEEIRFDGRPGSVREPRSQYATAPREPMLRLLPDAKGKDPAAVARQVGLIGEHPSVVREVQKAAAMAAHAVPVLIQGETGSGKGVMAKFIHELSDRANGPFVAVNCGALPENLAESLLFGHVKGAFTGAHADQSGRFLLAHEGTLFLDEIGDLPLTLQPKLLRVLEDGLVEAVGATRGRKVDVRLIAATHRDLKQAVVEKSFREDLYFRLCFATITLPPLRERRSDIHHLALHILDRLNRKLRTPKSLTPDAIRRLESMTWRGNIRDLENAIGRSALMTRGVTIDANDLLLDDLAPANDVQVPEPHEGFRLEEYLAATRTALIEKALNKAHGNQSAAARLLGVSPQAVHKFIQSRAP